jgi:hypothetical protein
METDRRTDGRINGGIDMDEYTNKKRDGKVTSYTTV